VAYEELFADVLAVIVSKDPKIMSRYGNRDFTRIFTSEEVQQWNSRDSHDFLDPVRSHIYQQILSKPEFAGRENEVLRFVFDILAEETIE
ncbi:MAG: hypothetical protein COW16_06755, partial [Sphingomonadales bacterium CG12_big_fil_rev_8_21_14_0_65_65_10]